MADSTDSLPQRIFDLVKDAVQSYTEDGAPMMGAGLAFYSLLSLAPAGAIVMRIVGLFYDPAYVEATLKPGLEQIFSDSTIDALFAILTSFSQPGGGRFFTTVVSVGLLIFGATGVFNSLKDALDRIWRVKSAGRGGFLGMLKSRGLALLSVLVLALVVVLLIIADRALAAMRPALNAAFPDIPVFQPQQFLREFISLVVIRFGLVWLVIAYTFRVLPDADLRWRDLWVGSALTALLFLLGQVGIGYYLGHTSVASAYGAAGSLVLILVWIYYSAQVFLLGAELTYAYADHFGRDIQPHRLSLPFVEAEKE